MATRARPATNKKDLAREGLDAALAILRDDPPRLKRLLRSVAELADELATLAEEAGQDATAKAVGSAATKLRGAAFLPASMSVPLLRRSLGKLVDVVAG